MMLFGTSRSRATKEQQAAEGLLALQKDEIRRRLDLATEVNRQLHATVSETQSVTDRVMEKLKTELKASRKALTAICKKLSEGAVVVDHLGSTLHINPAAERILGAKDGCSPGSSMEDVISGVSSDGVNLELTPKFFEELSKRIIAHLGCDGCSCTKDERIEKELPKHLLEEQETVVALADGTSKKLNVSLSVLDNDPESVDDIVYIFLLRQTS